MAVYDKKSKKLARTWCPVTNDLICCKNFLVREGYIYIIYLREIHIFPTDASEFSHLTQSLVLERKEQKYYALTTSYFTGEMVFIKSLLICASE